MNNLQGVIVNREERIYPFYKVMRTTLILLFTVFCSVM